MTRNVSLMDVLHSIALGFATALTWQNLIYCFIGVFVGTVIGVLPGLGPVPTISLLLPFSFTMDVASAVILMAGIYYGAQYGGSITAILVRIPGEASAVVTCLDGYAMARQGRAGAALGIAAFGSFIAGVIVTVALFLVGPALADLALAFGPAEYTALVLLGLLLVTQLSSGSQIDALLMVAFGLLLSTVGKDPIYGTERFTFGIFSLFDGLNIALLAMGVFGVAELLIMAEAGSARRQAGRPAQAALRAAAEPGRLAQKRAADPARHRARILARASARRRRHAVVVHVLRAGAAACRRAGTLRPWRHRGRRRARIRQQRGGPIRLRAAAQPRHPRQRRDGRDSRRAPDPGHHPGPYACRQSPGHLLRCDRQHDHRQLDPDRAQRAADLDLRAAVAAARLDPRPARSSCSA